MAFQWSIAYKKTAASKQKHLNSHKNDEFYAQLRAIIATGWGKKPTRQNHLQARDSKAFRDFDRIQQRELD
ncbi:MAG: hypothetical protein WAW36_13960 [Methylovulum miyakonense]|uniref:hypothetical protein n=1 Tax=Methylovulum miyakonense TaxID=645578 RepID=UPI003BB57811